MPALRGTETSQARQSTEHSQGTWKYRAGPGRSWPDPARYNRQFTQFDLKCCRKLGVCAGCHKTNWTICGQLFGLLLHLALISSQVSLWRGDDEGGCSASWLSRDCWCHEAGWRPAEVVTMGRTTARPHHRSHDCCTLTLGLNNKCLNVTFQILNCKFQHFWLHSSLSTKHWLFNFYEKSNSSSAVYCTFKKWIIFYIHLLTKHFQSSYQI